MILDINHELECMYHELKINLILDSRNNNNNNNNN